MAQDAPTLVHCATLHAPYGRGARVWHMGGRETPSVLRARARNPPPPVAWRQGEANPAIEGCMRAVDQHGVRRCVEGDLGLGEPLQLFGAAYRKTLDLREAQAAGAESRVELGEGARAPALRRRWGVAPEADGLEAEEFSRAGVDQDVQAGVEIIDDALEMRDPSWIIRVSAEPVDGALVLDVADQDVEEIARTLVQPSPRRQRVEGPEDDRHQAHEESFS